MIQLVIKAVAFPLAVPFSVAFHALDESWSICPGSAVIHRYGIFHTGTSLGCQARVSLPRSWGESCPAASEEEAQEGA